MKRIIVVGLGNFGSTIATRLHDVGHDVIAIDSDPQVVDAIGPRVGRAIVGDATSRAILEEIGAREADAAVVSTGDDMAASVLALLALRDVGVAQIYIKVRSESHARIADALGAEESIFPERESALGLASRITTGKLLNYVQLGREFSLQEMPVPESWTGQTLRSLQLPNRHRVQVVAVHDVLTDTILPVPDPDRVLTPSDALLVTGDPEALQRLAELR